jgi:hypothetical protein
MHFISALSGYENVPFALVTKPLQFLLYVILSSVYCLGSEAASPMWAAGSCGHYSS